MQWKAKKKSDRKCITLTLYLFSMVLCLKLLNLWFYNTFLYHPRWPIWKFQSLSFLSEMKLGINMKVSIRKEIKNKITGSCYKNNNFRKNITKYFSKASFSFIYTIVLKKPISCKNNWLFFIKLMSPEQLVSNLLNFQRWKSKSI